ncbi:MAG: hypothetical protein JNL70_03905 [Saprospiraceae bacterium]|nr:hypothetical protein [Saprospiraceae bacterium]
MDSIKPKTYQTDGYEPLKAAKGLFFALLAQIKNGSVIKNLVTKTDLWEIRASAVSCIVGINWSVVNLLF